MTKKKLERILRDLEGMDAEALSFDHEKASTTMELVRRVAEAAADLCGRIKHRPAREAQKPKGVFVTDQVEMARRAAREAKNPPRKIKVDFIGGGVKHHVTKLNVALVRGGEVKSTKKKMVQGPNDAAGNPTYRLVDDEA